MKVRGAGSQYHEGLVMVSSLNVALNRLSNKGTGQSRTKVVETHENCQPLFPRCKFSSLPS